MTKALAYLMLVSLRNQGLGQLRRIRKPRYALAFLLGVGYFALLGINHSPQAGAQPQVTDSATVAALLPIVLLVVTLYMWVFGTDGSALAFSQAEVSFLFPAPVSRRALVVYKIVRQQAATLATSVLWIVVIHHGSGGIRRAASYWLLLSTISLHRLGVALMRSSQAQSGLMALRRNWLAWLVFAAIVATVAGATFQNRATLFHGSWTAITGSLVAMVTHGPVRAALYPFHAVMNPIFTRTTSAWAATLAPALVVFAIHLVWVLYTERSFEEAAAASSARLATRLAALRELGTRSTPISAKSARRTLRLSPTGAPALALVWKNTLYLIRSNEARSMIGLPLACAVAAVAFAGRSAVAELVVMITCFTTTIFIVVFGPMAIRNDLRGDLARIPMLKTIPVPGRQILLAEVASSALPLAGMQVLLVLVGVLAVRWGPEQHLPRALFVGTLIVAPILLPALSFAHFTVHNGLALLFPAWVKTGEAGAAGFEAMGLRMLSIVIGLLLLALLLAAPALCAAVLYFLFRGSVLTAVLACGLSAAALLAVESFALISMLGGSLERLEPQI